MSLTEKILKELNKLSKTQKICKQGRYTTATAVFDTSSFDETLSLINNVIEPVAENGEKIICKIKNGEIIDSRVKGFDIENGVLIELYDYSSTTVAFIRLYHIKDEKKEWLALYIDENPDTPWWTDEERGVIQPDTIIPHVYNPQSLNRYSYVLNNPMRYTDTSGKKIYIC